MRQLVFLVFAVIASSASTYFITRSAEAEEKTTAIVADKANNLVRIMIGGEEVAQFSTAGLDVRGDIRFGGVMTDTVPGAGP